MMVYVQKDKYDVARCIPITVLIYSNEMENLKFPKHINDKRNEEYNNVWRYFILHYLDQK